MQQFQISESPIDGGMIRGELLAAAAGGYCSFEGWIRDHHLGKIVASLQYECYLPLAIRTGSELLEEAFSRFDIIDARAVHRVGSLYPGELAVWIGVTAVHRAPAFEACQFLIDAIKESVPIWKHEFYTDGTDIWVDPTDCSCSQLHVRK